VVAAAVPTDIAQDWGVGNPGGLGNGKGSGTLGSGCSLVLAGVGNGKSAKHSLLDEVHLHEKSHNPEIGVREGYS
jgi:hypothetical protein